VNPRRLAVAAVLAGFAVALPARAAVVAPELADVARTQPEARVVAWIRFADRAGA
jgi:hypothetical protein